MPARRKSTPFTARGTKRTIQSLAIPGLCVILSLMAFPALAACIEKEKLMAAFAKAVSDHHRMQSAQLAAVLRGDDGFPFEAEIAAAALARQQAKYAVLAHRETHGC